MTSFVCLIDFGKIRRKRKPTKSGAAKSFGKPAQTIRARNFYGFDNLKLACQEVAY
ncbi:MAG: hypothetical protein AVDCRST_MAG74-3926 [uncultured Pyrinomonadaceae bacterium]|uniref:Uncharacterized protein n=1 Tax=uncultured Pyrinomonadaceae bacterium TaxID=2283094 RepID=A0A6J4Q1D9_9BACT|nr:MAG: hypothetical protein AVDCRST_MAG74-3926 [uncultured Pyrinomonadaceae bacterium]